jgi:hypothetical protein
VRLVAEALLQALTVMPIDHKQRVRNNLMSSERSTRPSGPWTLLQIRGWCALRMVSQDSSHYPVELQPTGNSTQYTATR